jgi:hypothetical protein
VPTQINRLALYPVRMQGFFVLATKWPQKVSLRLRFGPQITRIYTDSLRGASLREAVFATDYTNLHRLFF